MCDGTYLSDNFQWMPFIKSARDDFKGVKATPGVYCVRVKKPGDTDIARVIEDYMNTDFVKAMKALDVASNAFFRRITLADKYGWNHFAYAEKRMERLGQMRTPETGAWCPILYIGGSRNVRRRLDELAYEGHTANHLVWALLLAHWELEVGWREAPAYPNKEEEFKRQYQQQHSGALPSLTER